MREFRIVLLALCLAFGASSASAQTTRTFPSSATWSDVCVAPCSVKALNGTVFFVLDTAPPSGPDAPQITWTPDNGLLPNNVSGVHVYARAQTPGASVSSIPSASGGSGGSGTANPYPGSDYATAARQDAQSVALGSPADAAYSGTGSAGNVALGKGQYAILSNLLASAGAQADAASGTTGSNGSQVALLKALRDKLNGTVTVSGAVAATQSGSWSFSNVPASSASSANAPTTSTTSSLLAKNAAGNLYGFGLTQGATAGFLAILDATSVPASGSAIAPKDCVAVAANGSLRTRQVIADRYTNGIVLLSTSSCSTYTAVTPVLLSAAVQ